MANAFLVYWVPEQIESALNEGALPHAAGGQLNRARVGDRLWIVGRAASTRELFIIGYLDVDQKLSERAAQAEMERRYSSYKVWHAKWHVVAAEGAEVHTKAVSLQPLYASLRFESEFSPRLKVTHSHPNAQQLQSVRRLTPDSSAALLALWRGTGESSGEARTSNPTATGTALPPTAVLDLDELDAKRTVLARLEQQAARALLLGSNATAACTFCARNVPAALIVAAHIKPRASCTLEEKKAIAVNVIGLCRLGCDDLYERGFVEVVDGRIVDGPALPVTRDVTGAKKSLIGNTVGGWTKEREKFFRWRRAHRAKWWA